MKEGMYTYWCNPRADNKESQKLPEIQEQTQAKRKRILRNDKGALWNPGAWAIHGGENNSKPQMQRTQNEWRIENAEN